MDKKLFTIVVALLVGCNLFAQVEEDFSTKYKMPIFPGCEKLISEEDQFKCFQQNITTSYSSYLEKYLESFEYLNIPFGESQLSFLVNQNGELILKNIDTTQPLFRDYNILAFQDFAKDYKITPAKSILTDKNVTIALNFPVGFKLSRQVLETNSRIISVIENNNSTYEIVITPDHELKIYELSDFKPIYLGKYNSLQEIKNTLPYKESIQDMQELVTLAQSNFGKEKFILQSKNIFQNDNFATIFIVSQVKGKRIKQLRKYTTLEDFIQSPYYDWIIRKDY